MILSSRNDALKKYSSMKQLTPTQITLLHILGDGLCHSGNALGQALGVTRSAVWKQMNQLIELGVPVNRIAQQGYQLPGSRVLMYLINKNEPTRPMN
ncbi:MAG: HTH domain-containing protein, partial [Legionellales bacterium]